MDMQEILGITHQITTCFHQNGIDCFGIADLRPLLDIGDRAWCKWPRAISFAVEMPPDIMRTITKGPNQAYAKAYALTNTRINSVAKHVATIISKTGYCAMALAASERTDPARIRGDFPHKTAATLAGLGWVGRNCQLITRAHGPWIRLGTIFTDMRLRAAIPIQKSGCGKCTRCVEACPAKALQGGSWRPGTARSEILDALKCDLWKKKHFSEFHNGHNCGICAAVCPFGK